MAPRDRPDQDVEPERRLARLLVERFDLAPPVDITNVASAFADLESDTIPGDCDAVVVGLNGDRPKPLIVLARGKPGRRVRFSTAHELGHVLIPWHTGSVAACHVERRTFGDYEYRMYEGQANRFASEVLLPHRWLEQTVDPDKPLEALREAETAQVSAGAEILAVSRYLAPGTILALERDGLFEIVAASPGTPVAAARTGAAFEPKILTRFADVYKTPVVAGRLVHVWRFGVPGTPTPASDGRTSRQIIDQILDERCSPDDRQSLRKSIFSIAGSAKGTYRPQDVAELAALLRMRYARPELAPLTSHPDFDVFVERRAEELLEP